MFRRLTLTKNDFMLTTMTTVAAKPQPRASRPTSAKDYTAKRQPRLRTAHIGHGTTHIFSCLLSLLSLESSSITLIGLQLPCCLALAVILNTDTKSQAAALIEEIKKVQDLAQANHQKASKKQEEQANKKRRPVDFHISVTNQSGYTDKSDHSLMRQKDYWSDKKEVEPRPIQAGPLDHRITGDP
jgi:hypothetical protein